eukprot:scaffold3161_cov247-Ochromonas_danica.AAC.3
MDRIGAPDNIYDLLEKLDARVSILETFIFGGNRCEPSSGLASSLLDPSILTPLSVPPIKASTTTGGGIEEGTESSTASLWLRLEELSVNPKLSEQEESRQDTDFIGNRWLDELIASPQHEPRNKIVYTKAQMIEIKESIKCPTASKLWQPSELLVGETILGSQNLQQSVLTGSTPNSQPMKRLNSGSSINLRELHTFDKKVLPTSEKPTNGNGGSRPATKRSSSRTVEKIPSADFGDASSLNSSGSIDRQSPQTELKFGLLVQYPVDNNA